METASNRAKRMDCTQCNVKHTRAMDPSDGIRAARLAAQRNQMARRGAIHRNWSAQTSKRSGGRLGLEPAGEASRPGPSDDASTQRNPGDWIRRTTTPDTPANPVKRTLHRTADRAEGVGGRAQPTRMDARSSAGRSDGGFFQRGRGDGPSVGLSIAGHQCSPRGPLDGLALNGPRRPIALCIRRRPHERGSTQQSDPVDGVGSRPRFC